MRGHRIYLDAQDSLNLWLRDTWEPVETRVLLAILSPGDVAVDVGAHIGYYVLEFLRRVGPTGRVIAFEPDSRLFTTLSRNVTLNGYMNATLLQTAAGDKRETLMLYRSQENSGDSRTYESKDSEVRDATPVLTLRADDVLGALRRSPRLVKIDVQGSELSVLRGLETVLTGREPCAVALEFWPYGLEGAGTPAQELLRYLADLRFRPWEISEETGTIRPFAFDPKPPGSWPFEQYTNLLCLRADDPLLGRLDDLVATH